jgi:hypothetical protein
MGRTWRKTTLACCSDQGGEEARKFLDRQVGSQRKEEAQEALKPESACVARTFTMRHPIGHAKVSEEFKAYSGGFDDPAPDGMGRMDRQSDRMV